MPSIQILTKLNQTLPRKTVRRGVATGVVLSLLATAGVTGASHLVAANGTTVATDTITSSEGSFGGQSEDTATAAATPSATASAPAAGPAALVQNTPAAATPAYTALGDSVAAGLGLPLIGNATVQDRTCGRSSQAYAYEVGRQLGRPVNLLACSGATAGDLNTRQGIDGPNPPSQLSAAFANGTPGLISITAGANDTYWQRLIQKCYIGTCGSRTDTTLVNGALLLMQGKYKVAMENIRLRSANNGQQPPRTVLTGYYNPLSAACRTTPAVGERLTKAELAWLNGSIAALNKTISDIAASYGSFARYAAVDFNGHDVCSAEPWVQGLTDAAPIHPTAAGQQAIARSVVEAARR